MSLQRHVTICISTVPDRRESLLATLRTLRGQANTILVWREGTVRPDPELGALGVTQIFMGTHIGPVAKLYLATSAITPFVFTCDDDILYPEDYVREMCSAIVRMKCPVAVHSHTYLGAGVKASSSKAFVHFKHKHTGSWCNFPGTGTFAFERGMFRPVIRYSHPHCADGHAAVELQLSRTPVWCIERHAGWLEPYPQDASVPTVWKHSKSTGHSAKQALLDSIPHWELFQPDDTKAESLGLR